MVIPPTMEAVAAAADRLIDAARRGVPCVPIRDLIGADDLEAAYAVQSRVARARLDTGTRVIGRKIGLTSKAVQTQLGVDQPDFGVLFADMRYESGARVPDGRLIQPRAEAEIAFVLGEDLAGGTLDTARVRGAIDYMVAAIEICDSRIADWDISLADTVADNASAGAFVLGSSRRTLVDIEPVDVVMSMSIDGVETSSGVGAACLGDPIQAVVWLARKAAELGDPLRSGQVILSGALGPMRAIAPGETVEATVSGLGGVSFSYGKGRRS